MKNPNKQKDLFSAKNISIGLLVVLLLPIPISLIISSGNWLSFIDGNSTVWIGFWGSYLGGIIGTIGVIYVAHLQNSKQIESIIKVEKYNRQRLRIEIQLKLLSDYSEDVNSLLNEVLILQEYLVRILNLGRESPLYEEEPDMNIDPEEYHKLLKEDKEYMKKIKKEILSLKSMNIDVHNITYKMKNIENKNELLKKTGLYLSEKLKGRQTQTFDDIIEFVTSEDFHFEMLDNHIKELDKKFNLRDKTILAWLKDEIIKINAASTNLIISMENDDL